MKYQITCCSTADMASEFFASRDVAWVPFHFIMDGQTYPDDLGKTMPFEEFYRHIQEGSMPTTSQVNVGEFLEFWEPFLVGGQDVLHVSLSSGLSGEYGSAAAAAQELMVKYPDRQICVLDSHGASSGYGMLVDKACDLRDQGMILTENFAWLEANHLRVHHWFFSTDLAHFKRGGRISGVSATLGSLLKICPVLNMDAEGRLIQRSKVRGKKNAIKEMLKCMEQHATGALAYAEKCFISNSACMPDAISLAEHIHQQFPKIDGQTQINSVGTVIGSHTGPGTVALFFWGDMRMA